MPLPSTGLKIYGPGKFFVPKSDLHFLCKPKDDLNLVN